jgi:hypothetical protein
VAKKQTRRTISLNVEVFQRFKAFCSARSVSMSSYAEAIILDELEKPPLPPPRCALIARRAADSARGIETSAQAVEFVRQTCPCADCEQWRKSPPPTPPLVITLKGHKLGAANGRKHLAEDCWCIREHAAEQAKLARATDPGHHVVRGMGGRKHLKVDCWCVKEHERRQRAKHEEKAPPRLEVLQQTMLAHINRWPQPAAAIFSAVINDYGEITERTLWRHLTLLVKEGRVIKHPKTAIDGFESEYIGHTYSKAKDVKR